MKPSSVRCGEYVKKLSRSVSAELEEFRADVKDIELEAERIEQAILFGYSKSISGSPAGADRRDVITENVKRYVAFASGAGERHSPERSAPYLIGAALRLRS